MNFFVFIVPQKVEVDGDRQDGGTKIEYLKALWSQHQPGPWEKLHVLKFVHQLDRGIH